MPRVGGRLPEPFPRSGIGVTPQVVCSRDSIIQSTTLIKPLLIVELPAIAQPHPTPLNIHFGLFSLLSAELAFQSQCVIAHNELEPLSGQQQ